MPYTIKSYFSPAHELIVSLSVFMNRKMHKRTERGSAWVEETRSRLTPEYLDQLAGHKTLEHCDHLKLLAYCSPEKTVPGFIDWLEQLSPGDIYEQLSSWVKYFPQDLGEMRDTSVALLKEWDRQYFSTLDPSILDKLEEESRVVQAMVNRKDPVELIEQTTNGLVYEPMPVDETTVLFIPQYHAQPVTLCDHFEGLMILMYASNLLPEPVDGEPSPGMHRMIRALSDMTRLRILHFLKTGPRMYMEIVQYLDMSKSTVYEHMLTLRSAGLVRAHSTNVEKTSHFYSLRPEAIDILRDELHHFLL
jgi:DNA-binding transcriptional ArsR family regulator